MYNEQGQTSRKKIKRGSMTKKILLFLFLLSSGVAMAQEQDLDISLFDDDIPVLGRTAPPLDSLRLTPPPAPDIRIDLDNSQDQRLSPTPPPAEPLPSIPSAQIDLSNASPAPIETKPVSNGPPTPVHDVSSFEVSDFSLGISPDEVFRKAKQKGFKVVLTQENIPLYYATDYAYQCRQRGLVVPDQLSQCIKDYACHQKTRYISEAKLTRKNEIIHLYFTSNATGNLLYKILYINKGDNSLNFTRINKAKKELRHKEFWDAIFAKYGAPDDGTKYIWGNPSKAYMKAYMSGSNYDAFILMEDVTLSSEDYFEAKDVEDERPARNTFAF